jgi:hypothetical protein
MTKDDRRFCLLALSMLWLTDDDPFSQITILRVAVETSVLKLRLYEGTSATVL